MKKMKLKNGLKIKGVLLLGVFILTLMFLTGFAKSQESQTEIYCAEKTTWDAWCQNVPIEEVDDSYRFDRTSCESTTYCSIGTCVNTLAGECLPGPQATCDPAGGGFFYNQPSDEVGACQKGCCLRGDGATIVERIECDTIGKDYDVQATFREDIQDEILCSSLASPQAKGACIFEIDRGRDCDFTTRGQCQDSAGEFHEGFLCTAPELGTLCARTQRTTCVEGKNEVYYVDQCGNTANIYDANKINDIAYWSYVPGVEGVQVDLGDGEGNINSRIYGACEYFPGGSTCGSGTAQYGNYVCKDLNCKSSDLTHGVNRRHGESWCSEPLKNFEDAKPGQLSYLLYCINGEVQYELCDGFRNEICLENEDTGAADCVLNLWQACIPQNNTKDCLNLDKDCQVIEGAGVVRTSYGTERLMIDSNTGNTIKASCVPKYTPGFKFWDPKETLLDSGVAGETPTSICHLSSVVCYVQYTQEVVLVTEFKKEPNSDCVDACKEERNVKFFNLKKKGDCRKECTPICLKDGFMSKDTYVEIEDGWAESFQNLCVSLGDCGVSENYLGIEGYYQWKDLFSGKRIDWKTLVNANRRR